MSVGFSFSHLYSLLVLIVVLFPLCTSNGNLSDVLCKVDERKALLDFKHGLIDETNRLASWVGPKSDCCNWAGIVCDNSTGHVQKVHLQRNCYTDDYSTVKEEEECSKQRLSGNLSQSLLHLKQLKHLDLSRNDFKGIQIPSFIGSLGKLRYLNLSRSGFGGTVPPQLGNLSELHTLCLGSFYSGYSYSELISMRNMDWLSSLRGLHHLDMSGVDLSKANDNWLQVINTLPSLIQLHLSYSKLSNAHPNVASLNLTSLACLDLSGNYFSSSSPPPQWIFSTTSLVSLDLTLCGFHDSVSGGIELFHNLTSLESLHVSGNYFMNSSLVLKGLSGSVGRSLVSLDINRCGISSSVLDSLHNLTSLRSLDLSSNELTNTIPKSMTNLCNLRHIDLKLNSFPNISLSSHLESFFECKKPFLESLSLWHSGLSGELPHELGKLTYLVHLELADNGIMGIIPDSIGRLSSLESLDLRANHISGPIPNSIGRLSSLKLLDLSFNHISGPIPNSVGGLSSLEELDLSYNQLNGSLPVGLGQLSKLVHLDFSINLLTGVVTKSHFVKLERLKFLHGEGNNLTLRSCHGDCIPSFQLVELSLSSWDLGPQFPLWLQFHIALTFLDISNTRISSSMPDSFWRSLPNLRYLDISQNHIQGILPTSIPSSLLTLDASSNKFGGPLPQLSNPSHLDLLELSNNSFTGSLRNLLCPNSDKMFVTSLNLANNQLSGVIPDCWLRWQALWYLNLANNNLSGRIPTSLGSLSSLGLLDMCNNKLSGRLHVSMKNLTSLEILLLAGNELVGSIPAWFWPWLSILNLRSNKFDGNITHQLCNLTNIQILDLSHNNLSGNIPSCFNNFNFLTGKQVTSSSQFFFRSNRYKDELGSASLVIKGREDTYSTILGLVVILDLSGNNFSGQIPSEIMALKALQSLNLSRNQLTGRIPENIGDLKLLESLDLSLNSLSGELPVSLSSLSFMNHFNVSYNNLSGRVPSSTQLRGFNESCFIGNKLCGEPLALSCDVKVHDKNQEEDKNGSNGADWGLIICMVAGLIAGFWAVLAPLIVSTRWRIAYFGLLTELRYMFCDCIRIYWCTMFRK